MSTITLERIPKAGGASTTKTLQEWGLAPGSMECAAWVVGYLTLTALGESPAFADPVFEYRDTIKLYEDGVCIWWGPVVSTGSTVQPAQQRTYTVADPMWWAQWAEFRYPYTPEPEMLDTKRGKVWLTWALNRAASLYPIGYVAADLGDLSVGTAGFAVPCPDLRSSANCLEVIQRVARLHPLSSQWWDLSGETPVLRCALRTGLAAVELARSRCQEPIQLTPLHDKQLTAVWLEYVFTNYSGTRSAADDKAGTAPYTGPNTLHAAMKIGTDAAADEAANYTLAYQAQAYQVADMLYATWAALPWAGSLTIVGTPDLPLPAIRPGQLLNLTGGRTEWAVMNAQVQRVGRTIGETCDRMTVELGCGEHLGPTDLLALARTGVTSGGAAGGNPSPFEPPAPPAAPATPGTLDDLNGGTFPAAPLGSLLTQAQGGTCRISGCPPLDGVETYRRWRTQTASGTLRRYGWIGNTVCSGNSDPTSWALSGTCQWTGNDDTTVFNAMQYVDELSVTYAMAYGVVALPGYYYASQGTQTITATKIEYIGSGECIPDYGTPAASARSTGSEALTLSNEDTEDTAWPRMLAITSPGWATSETGTYSARTALTYLRQRYRYGLGSLDGDTIVATSGWTPWGVYEVTVQLQTHPVTDAGALTGDGAWTDLAQRTHLIQGDIDGKAKLDWQEEEPPRGYALRAVLVSVAPITS